MFLARFVMNLSSWQRTSFLGDGTRNAPTRQRLDLCSAFASSIKIRLTMLFPLRSSDLHRPGTCFRKGSYGRGNKADSPLCFKEKREVRSYAAFCREKRAGLFLISNVFRRRIHT